MKIVIAGSVSRQNEIVKWKKYWEKKSHIVIDYPKPIEKDKFLTLYPSIHKAFFENIVQTDVLFVMNEDKNSIMGYIGSETFAELTFAVVQNLLYRKNIKIIIYKMPSIKVGCYEEVALWLSLEWIEIYKE